MPNIISIELQSLTTYSLSAFNSGIALIDEIIIKNDCDYNLKNLDVEITSTPSVFAPCVKKIPIISAGRYAIINGRELDIDIDLTKIMYTSSPFNATINVRVKSTGERLEEITKSILILPFDYVSPINDYAELVSCLVTPEQDEIKVVASSICEELKNTKTPVNPDLWDFDNKNTVRDVIKAIYKTVKDLRITLDAVSPYAESKHFRVQLPEVTFNTRGGNSLDIAIMISSVSEALGVNTFIVFLQDKILLGFFYNKDHFDTCISDDGRMFSENSNTDNDAFCVIDVTSVMNGTQISFEDSKLSAYKLLENCDYPIVVDIAAARENGYIPLPNRVRQSGNIIFDSSAKSIIDKNTPNYDVFRDSVSFASFLRKEILSKGDKENKKFIDFDKSIFLVGGATYITGKLFLNRKLALKGLPLPNSIVDSADFISQLTQINSNIDSLDTANSINCIHDKDSMNKRAVSVLNSGKKEFFSIYLTLGIITRNVNGNFIAFPVFFLPVSFDIDSSKGLFLKLASTEFFANASAFDELEKAGIAIDASEYKYDILDKFDNFVEKLSNNDGIQFYDVSTVSAFNVDSQNLSDIATPEFFCKSNILNEIFNNGKLQKSTESETDSDLNRVDLPFELDSTQMRALNLISNNSCTVVKGPNGSGKTRVSASLAFSEIRKGKKVLYLSNSDGNVKNFMKFAEDARFNDFVMHIPDDGKTVNTFDAINFSNAEDKSQELTEVTKYLSEFAQKHDSYYYKLHEINEIGFTLYEAASQYERYSTFPYSVNFTSDEISVLTRDRVVAWFDAVSSAAKAGADCKEPYSNPLAYVRTKDFSYELKSKAAISLNSHLKTAETFIDMQNRLGEFLGIGDSIMKEKQTQTLLRLLDSILKCGSCIHHGIFSKNSVESDFSKLDTLTLKCDEVFSLRDYVTANFTDDILSYDCDYALTEWRNAISRFAFAKTSAMNVTKNKLKAYCIDSKFITNDNFVECVTKISRYKNCISLLYENASLISTVTGIDIKQAIEANERDVFEKISSNVAVSREYLMLLSEICDDEKQLSSAHLHQSALFKNYNKLLADITAEFESFPSVYKSYTESENALTALLDIDVERAKIENSKIWYYYVTQFFTRMSDNIDLLKYWCNWNTEKEKARALGLNSFIDLYESEQISSNDVKNAFLKGFFKAVTEYFISCLDPNYILSSDTQKNADREIRKTVKTYRSLLSDDLNYRVINSCSKTVSKLGMTESEAEIILKRDFSYEINSDVDEKLVSLLQSAKPCFVCESPNFLTKFKCLPHFDTVIVDCTSARMQYSLFLLLPITEKLVIMHSGNFYSNNLVFPQTFIDMNAASTELGWLYNTSYASSIVNELFYGNKLTCFATCKSSRGTVNVIQQNGSYDRKKTRVNVIEASAVADEVFRIFSDSPHLSVGVYAMTEQQRELIEMLIYKRASSYGDLSFKLYEKGREKLFIRSYSSAQYDPRDVIVLSTVFSEESKPKYKDTITKTIPELSKKNGITKLIHIMTSARRNMTVVTSLTKDSLQRFKTTEKNYLIFKKAVLRLMDNSNYTLQDTRAVNVAENPIVRKVANHIESLGYKTELYVGINKCKIDIAVKNKNKNQYLLGIIFDESVYINSDGFFSRDVITSGLEEFGGWKILRIFTVEWFENQSKQLDLITSALNGDDFDKNFPISTNRE